MGWRLASFTLEYEDDLNFYWSIVIDEVVFVDR